jgi:Arc/MetJ-type ribon-helix-helix transcriptional regulator
MANVIIDSGELEPTTKLYNVPRERWRYLMQKRRSFLKSKLPFDCRALLQFVDEAERMYEQLGFSDADDFIRNGLELDPQQVNWAVDGLRQMRPNDPVPYKKAIERGKLRAVGVNQHTAGGSNTTSSIGRGRAYIIARLERDGEIKLAEKVSAGRMSANAAAEKMGYRKKPVKRCPKCGHEW